MPNFGFPAQPRQSNLASLIDSLKSRADDVRVETVTGRRADPTRALSGRVNELLQIEKSLTDLREYGDIIALSEARASTIQQSLNTVATVSGEVADQATLLLTNATDANLEIVSKDARGRLDTVVNALNIDFAGRSLFSGDGTGNTALASADTMFSAAVPVLESPTAPATAYQALEAEFMNAGGLFETTFYSGGAGSASSTEVAPGERVDYSAKADEDPVRRVLFNLTVLAAANDRTNTITEDRRDLTTQASDGLRSALSELISIQSRVGTAEERIATTKTRNIAAEAAFTLTFNDLAGRNQADAIVELTDIENQLETAFVTSSRLSNLSLTNFL